MNESQKKAILVFGLGFALFWLFKPKMRKLRHKDLNKQDEEAQPTDRKTMKEPVMNPSDAKDNPLAKVGFGAMKSYIKAYNNKEPQSVLDELNREFAKEFKVKILRRKSDNKLVAYDLQGNEVLVNEE